MALIGGIGGSGGYLSTDPRKKKGPTGGSISAAQSRDSSVIQTGDPKDSIGFASPSAGTTTGGVSRTSEYYRPHTAQEFADRKVSQGIAPTHESMGALSQQYRADADAAHAAGQLSVSDKKAQKVIDMRKADDYNVNVVAPANERLTQQKAVSSAQKAYINKFKADSSFGGTKFTGGGGRAANTTGLISASQRSNATMNTSPTQSIKDTLKADIRSGNILGSTGKPWMGGPMGPASTPYLTNTQAGGGYDPLGLDAMRSHSEMPYTQTLSGKEAKTAAAGSGGGLMDANYRPKWTTK